MSVKSSLYGRMLVSIGIASVLPFLLIFAIALTFGLNTVSKGTSQHAETLSLYGASQVSQRIESFASSVRTLAATFSGYAAIPPASRREVISTQVRDTLVHQPSVLAAWAQWEPGAIGDDPAPYRKTVLSTESGAFDATWYRVSGQLWQGRINDSTYQGDFYTMPKANGGLVLINPYRYSYTGKTSDEVLETTLCMPIVTDGAFKGVVGFDFPIAVFNDLLSSPQPLESSFSFIITGEGVVVGHPRPSLVGTVYGSDLGPLQRSQFLDQLRSEHSFTMETRAADDDNTRLVFLSPIVVSGVRHPWYYVLTTTRTAIFRPAEVFALELGGIMLLGLVIIAVAILGAARRLSRPIVSLAKSAKHLAEGDLSQRVSPEGPQETRILALAFNNLAENVQTAMATLETRVAERTQSLKKANTDLERTLKELQHAQDSVEISAKMAIIGRLAANVAHGLNTPLGAIRSSATTIREVQSDFFLRVIPFYASLEEAERGLFFELIQRGREAAARVDKTRDRKRKRELRNRLETAGVEMADAIADEMDSLGLFDHEEALRASKHGFDIVLAVASCTSLFTASDIIMEASQMASSIVSALSNYSRSSGLDHLELVRPCEGIDTVLLLYRGKVGTALKVERRYEYTDPIVGYGDRLKELWANLVNNALQAMGQKGVLAVRVYRDQERVVVTVSDTGPGIPEAIRDRIFTPFFTTKAPGEGTGIGLDICRRIVEMHGGSIDFETASTGTTFEVRLPISGPPALPPIQV